MWQCWQLHMYVVYKLILLAVSHKGHEWYITLEYNITVAPTHTASVFV
jgi:hypothetical protein